MDNTSTPHRGLWLAVILVGSAVVGTITGLAFYFAHAPMLGILGSAGAAFLGTATFAITAWRFVAG